MNKRIFAPLATERHRPRLALVVDRTAEAIEQSGESKGAGVHVDQVTDETTRLSPLMSAVAALSSGFGIPIWFVPPFPEQAGVSEIGNENAVPKRRSWLKAVTAAFRKNRERRKQKIALQELRALDSHLLRDIGIEPGDLWSPDGLPIHLGRCRNSNVVVKVDAPKAFR